MLYLGRASMVVLLAGCVPDTSSPEVPDEVTPSGGQDGRDQEPCEDPVLVYQDLDGDGYGDASTATERCEAKAGWVEDDSDCNDSDAALHPDTIWYADSDGDGYGTDEVVHEGCSQPIHASLVQGDCDDGRVEVNPDAQEVCDGVDNDCDGSADDGDGSADDGEVLDPVTFYADVDGDGWGDPAAPVVQCWLDDGVVTNAWDCEDTDPDIHPMAEEDCLDAVDWDCSGRPDNGCDAVLVEDDAAFSVTADNSRQHIASDLAFPGDLDGDGHGDLLIGARGTSAGLSYRGGVFYLPGPHEGADTITGHGSQLVEEELSYQYLGDSITWGDVTADGVPDLSVMRWGEVKGGEISVLSAADVNGEYAFDDGSAFIFGDADSGLVGTTMAIGDLDDDGADDLVLGDPLISIDSLNQGRITAYLAPVTGTYSDDKADITIVGGNQERLGTNLEVLDVDGDGVTDLLTASPSYDTDHGGAMVFVGPLTGTIDSADADIVALGAWDQHEAGTAVVAVDLDGDGHRDLAVGAQNDGYAGEGAVNILMGPLEPTMSQGHPDAKIVGAQETIGFGGDITAGDLDGDGAMDLAVLEQPTSTGSRSISGSSTVSETSTGRVGIFYGPVQGLRDAAQADLLVESEGACARSGCTISMAVGIPSSWSLPTARAGMGSMP